MSRGIPPKVRDEVRARSNDRCEICGYSAMHMHHRKMRSQGGRHAADNLLHVCRECHDLIHRNPTYSYEKGWLIPSWQEAS